MSSLRILVISEFFYPHPAAGQRVSELLRFLARRGHPVTVIASASPAEAIGSKRLPDPGDALTVVSIRLPGLHWAGLAGKALRAIAFQALALIRALLLRRRFDLLITVSTPPLAHVCGVLLARLRRTRHIFWCADVHPDAAIRLGVIRENSLLARSLRAVNRWALGRCGHIVVVGRCMRELLIRSGAPADRVSVIPMWHREEIGRGATPAELARLAEELGVSGRFVVAYSGNLGRVHQFDTLLDAASVLERDPDFRFLISGSGPGMAQVAEVRRRRRLTSLVTRPLFPESCLAAALALPNVHLITLGAAMSGVSVPGKVYGAMAAGRPVIFIGPDSSEVALTIREERCGFVIAPGDVASLVAALERLKADPALARELGERARQAFFDRHALPRRCSQWADLIETVANPGVAKVEQLVDQVC